MKSAPSSGRPLGSLVNNATLAGESGVVPRNPWAPSAGQTVLPWGPAQLDLSGRAWAPDPGPPAEVPDRVVRRFWRAADGVLRPSFAPPVPAAPVPQQPRELAGVAWPAVNQGQLELRLAEAIADRQRARRDRYAFRDELRPFALACGKPRRSDGSPPVNRVERCGRVRHADRVELWMGEGRAFWKGLHRCASVWCCPVCSGKICADRADEIRRLVAWWGPDRTWMCSLTIRHALSDDAREMFRGITAAWRDLITGNAWKAFKRRIGLEGYVRAFETTIGPAGWHPHLHVLLLVEEPVKPGADISPHFAEHVLATTGEELVDPKIRKAWRWLHDRWAECVRERLGAKFEPSEANGVDLRSCRVADYIAKLGLELAGVAKEGRGEKSRTPWELARDVVAGSSDRDVWLWSTYQRATHGRRHITWSRGLKARAGIVQLEDEEIVELEDATPAALVYVIRGELWDRIRTVPRAAAELLDAAELRGPVGVRDALVSVFARRNHVSPRAGPPAPSPTDPAAQCAHSSRAAGSELPRDRNRSEVSR